MKRYYAKTERGRLGSLDGPAIRTASGLRQWLVDGRIHRSDGPAVETASGTALWYWRGVLVPRCVIEDPRGREPMAILDVENIEVRRAWLEAYGLADALDSLITNRKVQVVHAESKPEPRRLLRIIAIRDTDGEHPQYVEVRCPSTGRLYHLRVPPQVKTCTEAVAWTFRVDAASYSPRNET